MTSVHRGVRPRARHGLRARDSSKNSALGTAALHLPTLTEIDEMSKPNSVMVVLDDRIQTRPGYASLWCILLKFGSEFAVAAHRACAQALVNRDAPDSTPASCYVRFDVPQLPNVKEVATGAILHYQGATGTPAGLVYLHYVAERDQFETVDIKTSLEQIDYAMSGGRIRL